jgi:hypothetical protein
MSKMSIMEKIYFISAWVVAGSAGLALILSAIALRNNGLQAFGAVLDWIAVGITGCLILLYFSGWFRNNVVMFIMAWVVGGLVLLSMILTAAANLGRYRCEFVPAYRPFCVLYPPLSPPVG